MKGMKNMKKIVMIIVMLSTVVLVGTAQNFNTAQINNQAIQSHQIMQTGATYQGTVYEPFSSAAPSEYHPAASDEGSSAHVLRRFPKPGETGQSEAYPLGDAVLPLMLCALAFGVVIARRRQHAE